jgi:hypothetical protein
MPLVSKSRVLFYVFFIGFTCWLQAQNWLHHPGGTPFSIHRLYADTVTNKVIAAGAFQMVGNVPAQGIAVWDDTIWSPTGIPAFTSPPNYYSVGKYNNDYVFGATIPDWASVYPYYVVRWNGVSVDSIGRVGLGGITTLTQWGNDLIVTSFYDTDLISGVPFNSIARWDGVNWYDMGQGLFNGPMDAVEVYKNELYVTSISSIDNRTYIYKRVGSGWQTVGQSFGSPVTSMCVYNNELYVGGAYNSNNGFGNAILKLDTITNNWVIPGGGVAQIQSGFAQVNEMTVMGGKLYVAGAFELAGGVSAACISTWDGSQWCGLGNSTTYPPRTCAALDSSVFFVPNGMFDGVQSTTGFVEWIGGSYTDTCGFLTTSLPEVTQEETLLPSPNPASDHVLFTLPATTAYRIWIMNSLGQTVLSSAGRNSSFIIEVEDYAQGIYFYCVETDEGRLFRGNFCVSKF